MVYITAFAAVSSKAACAAYAQAVFAAVRTWVKEMQAGGPAAKGQAAQAEPVDAAARAATAKAEAESRAQVRRQRTWCICICSIQLVD